MKKKFLAVLLAACMVAAMLVPASAATTFDDVAEDAWYASSVERWTNYGILEGKGEGKFEPEAAMTRAEFAKVIVELLGLDHESTETPFDDVEDHWAAGHIAAAYNAGIINGMGDGKFAPGNDVSFNDSAAMLARATGLVDSKAYGDVVTEKLEELGMLDENVKADATASRALVAALADNMIGKYITADTIEAETEDGVIAEDVKGVILVVGGEDLKVEVKDAKVSAIVVQGGEVALTGETTVGSVKVSGEKAAVTADEGTKIESVTVDGTDAKVELNGEVESVTVAKDATVAELGGTGVSKDKVTNESANEITVNGETIDAAPAEENPDDNQGDDDKQDGGEVANGVVPEATGYTVEEPSATLTGSDVNYTADIKVKDENGDDTEEAVAQCTTQGGAVAHTWKLTGDTATCLSVGDANYKCETCGATTTVTNGAPAKGHTWVNVTPAGFTTGIACGNANCDGTTKDIGGETKCWQVEPVQVGGDEEEEPGPAAHVHVANSGSTADAYNKNNTHHWKKCTADGCSLTAAPTAQEDQTTLAYAAHDYVYKTGDDKSTTGTCVCGATETCDHTGDDVTITNNVCSKCHMTTTTN